MILTVSVYLAGFVDMGRTRGIMRGGNSGEPYADLNDIIKSLIGTSGEIGFLVEAN